MGKNRRRRLRKTSALFIAVCALCILRLGWISLLVVDQRSTSVIDFHSAARRNEIEKVTSSCMRPCKHYKNKMVLDHFGLNGLSDRESIFRVMTELAGYLCATLYIPPPSTMLSVSHNGNRPIDLRLLWRDFYSVRFRRGGVALKQFQASAAGIQLDKESLVLSELKAFKPEAGKDDPWFRISTKEADDFVKHFAQLDAFVQTQQSESSLSKANAKDAFLWEIYVPYFYWRNELALWFSHNSTNDPQWIPKASLMSNDTHHCSYTDFRPSSLAASLVEKVYGAIDQKFPNVDSLGLFHIRRGDSIDACDTSLPAIHEYLKCSFKEQSSVATNFGNMAILMASDERDSCYRSAIAKLVEKGLGYIFVDLDDIILQVLRESRTEIYNGLRLVNNMYIYHISRLVMSDARIKIVLEKRRTVHCPSCTNVVQEYPPALGSPRFDPLEKSPLLDRDWSLSAEIASYEECQQKLIQ